MKKNMPEYITTLSDNNYEILEEIFEDKYHKFTQLYWLLKEYSDSITSLKYKSTDKDVLKIHMTVEGLDNDEVVDEIRNNIGEDCNVDIWNDGDIIHIKITKDEDVPY